MNSLKIKWKDISGTTSGRISLAILLFMITIGIGFLTYTYNLQLEGFTKSETAKLKGIATTLSTQIDGDLHRALFQKFKTKESLTESNHCPFYNQIHLLLKKVKDSNELDTDIYTLVIQRDNNAFLFGVTSSETPYFRHTWTHYTQLHKQNYQTGGVIGPYEDENGIWLSAFAPVFDGGGNTVAIIQVDEPFAKFIATAQRKIWLQLSILIAALVIMVFFMLRFVQNTMSKEEKVKKILSRQRAEIETKNSEIVGSINRAKSIQDAILPGLGRIQSIFPEMFVLFQPRDIVSGDFFWWAEKGTRVYFAVADCTGHGVPGAFMSLIGHTLLNDALQTEGIETPGEVLTELDKLITSTLYENGNPSTDGMDMVLLSFDKFSRKLDFAGALRPLIKMSQHGMTKYNGDKFSIGGHRQNTKVFTTTQVEINPGDTVYLFTDGYSDQFGGVEGKKYMSRKFREFLGCIHDHDMEEQHMLLKYEFHLWKEDEDQVDDILVAGIRIPDAA